MIAIRRSFALALALSLVILQPLVASAASVRLTADLVPAGVHSFKISPDGQWVVYEVRDYGVAPQWSLHTVPLGGGAAVPLFTYTAGGNPDLQYFITPDSKRVIYGTAYGGRFPMLDLWSVPIAGPEASAVRLTGAPAWTDVSLTPAWGSARDITYVGTPAGLSAVFRGFDEETEEWFLEVVPVAGSPDGPRRLSLEGVSVGYYQATPDGRSVVYWGQRRDRSLALYDVTTTGDPRSAVVLDEFVPGVRLGHADISADGRHLIYSLDNGMQTYAELRSVDLTTPVPIPLSLRPPDVAGGRAPQFQIVPDGSSVVYRDPGDYGLHLVPIVGPAAEARLLAPSVPGLIVGESWWIAADGAYVLCRVYDQASGDRLLWSVPLDGSPGAGSLLVAVTHLMYVLPLDQGDRHVLYLTERQDPHIVRLFSVPVTAAEREPALLGEAVTASGGGPTGVSVNADRSKVLFVLPRDPAFQGQLYQVPIDGPANAAIELNGPLAPGGGVWLAAFAPDGVRVVYSAQQLGDGSPQLYVADDGKALVGFGAYEMMVAENGGEVQIPLRLSQPSVLPVTVTVVVDTWTDFQGEGLGFDCELPSDKVTFPPGETEAYLTLRPIDDGVPEVDPPLLLALTAPENAGLSSMSRIRIRIVDWAGFAPQVGR